MSKQVEIEVVTKVDDTELSSLKETIEEVKQTAQETGEDVSESLEEVGSGAEEAESSVEELDESLQNVNGDSFNEVTTAADELNDVLDEVYGTDEELIDSLNNINGDGLNNASSEADGLSDSLQNATGSADGLGDSLGIIESASFMGLADGIGQYAAGAENLAQEMNTAAISVGQLATNVGMAEPQMVSLINYISNATFPQSEAMAYVNALNQMGVEASKLGDAATNMDKINDATHIGYKSTMQLTQGLQAVGVSADNLPSSFNAIAYAQANVNGGAETLSTVLKRQAATINEYGLNVDQLVLIMQKLSERGVQGMKMGSELSKVLKETNGDTQALEQSLGMTAGALSNAGNATGEYEGKLQQLANEEAEHKTWIDLLNAAWEDMSLALSPVLNPLASFVGLIGQFGQFALAVNSINSLVQSLTGLNILEALGGKFSGLKSHLVGIASSAKSAAVSLGTTLKTALVSVGSAMKDAALWAVNLGRSILEAGYNALKTVAIWVVEKAQIVASTIAKGAATVASYALAAAEWLAASPVLLTVGAIVALIAVLWYLYNTNESVRNAIDGFIAALWGVGEAIYGSLMGAFEWLQGAWQNTVDFFTGGGQSLWDSITGVFTGISETIVGLLGGAFTTLQGIWDTIVNTFMTYAPLIAQILFVMATGGIGAIVLLVANFMGMPNQVGGALQNVISRVASFVSDIVARLGNGARQAVSNFANGINNLGQALRDEINEMLNDAANFVGQIGQIMWEAAVNAWQNFLSGLGRHSPGIIQTQMIAELTETGDRIPRETKPLISNVGDAAKNIVKAWGNPVLDYSVINDTLNIPNVNKSGGGDIEVLLNRIIELLNKTENNNSGNTFILNGDIDNEDRMEKFIQAVVRELRWENDKAGRTV